MPLENEIDAAAMAEADAALLELTEAYPAYAAADVVQMESIHAALARGDGAPDGLIAELHGVAHNIKGQGAAFGYDLMTRLGGALCGLTRDRTALDAPALDRVGALVAACRAVIERRLVGGGGAEGARLSAELDLAPLAFLV